MELHNPLPKPNEDARKKITEEINHPVISQVVESNLRNFCNLRNRKRKGIVAGQRTDELHEIFATCEIVLQLISSLSCSDSFPLPILQVGFHNLQNCWMVDSFCNFLSCILVWLWQRVMILQSLVSS